MGHREGGGDWGFRGTLDGAGGRCWAAVRDIQQGGEGKPPRGGSSQPEVVATWVRRWGYSRGLKVKLQVWGRVMYSQRSGVLAEPGKVGMHGLPRDGSSRKVKSEVLDVQVVWKPSTQTGREGPAICSAHLLSPGPGGSEHLLTCSHLTSVSRYLAELCGVGTCGGEPRTVFPTVSSAFLLSVGLAGCRKGGAAGRSCEGGAVVCVLEPLPLLSPGGEAAFLPVPGGPGQLQQ